MGVLRLGRRLLLVYHDPKKAWGSIGKFTNILAYTFSPRSCSVSRARPAISRCKCSLVLVVMDLQACGQAFFLTHVTVFLSCAGFAGLRAGVLMAHGAVPHVRPVHGRQGARVSGCHVLPHGPRKAS